MVESRARARSCMFMVVVGYCNRYVPFPVRSVGSLTREAENIHRDEDSIDVVLCLLMPGDVGRVVSGVCFVTFTVQGVSCAS